jgi:hypothetical protein
MRRSRRVAYSARTFRRAIVCDGRASEPRLEDREAGELEHLLGQLRTEA